MKALANEIYEKTLDLDFLDYEETKEKDLTDLKNDLEILEAFGNGALLNAIKNLIEQ